MTTNNNHLITPPPELYGKWYDESPDDDELGLVEYVATQAARWGSNQELEACCELIGSAYVRDKVRAARRPKPPSLKEQALEAMSRCDSEMWCEEMEFDLAIIRTALESLPS